MLMEALIKVSLRIMKFGEWANIFGLMVKCMKVNGRKIKCIIMEYSYGGMVKDMRDNL